MGKRPMEMLARAGAFDELDRNRRRVFDSLDGLIAYSAAIHEQRASNQVSLFGEAGDDLPEPRLSPVDDWMPAERLIEESKGIGFFLSGHPLEDYSAYLRRSGVKTLAEVERDVMRAPAVVKIAGYVEGRQERKSARGNRFAFVQLTDEENGEFEVTVFSEALEASREHLDTGSKVVVTVEATMEADQLKLLCRAVAPIDDVAASAGAIALRVFIDGVEALDPVRSVLERAKVDKVKGARGPITVTFDDAELGEVDVEAPDSWPVSPQIRAALRSLPG